MLDFLFGWLKPKEVPEDLSWIRQGMEPSEFVPALSPINWPVPRVLPTKPMEAEWLVSRLLDYQAVWPRGERGIARNSRVLAGDLFAAGFETESLAWIWGSSEAERIDEEAVCQALAEVGICLFQADVLRAAEYRDCIRAFLDGSTSLRTLSRSLFGAGSYDNFAQGWGDIACAFDSYDERDAVEPAREFGSELVPYLDRSLAEIVEQVRRHLGEQRIQGSSDTSVGSDRSG